MANEPTADTGLLPRTYFRAPRVPLDLRALFLALVGYGVYHFGTWGLEKVFDKDVVGAFFGRVLAIVHVPLVEGQIAQFVRATFAPEGLASGTIWHEVAGGAWVFLVWGFFGQAIHRITALRIARDEGLSVKDALAFATKNYGTILLCPVIVAGAIGLFYGCNALAGLVLAIPFLGGVLGLVLLPLAAISTLLIVLIAIGAAVGMPLVGAAAAWERNGSLDAISRAFSYLFARPLQMFWNYLLILVFAVVILIVGGHFLNVLTGSVDAGMWREAPSVLVDTPTDPDDLAALDKDTKEMLQPLFEDPSKQPDGPPLARSIHAVGVAKAGDKMTVFLFWLLLNLVHYGFVAAAIWWFLGATTSTYADLRADVDGTEEDEIYLEDEEEDFAELAKTPSPPPPPSPAAPSSPAPPPVNPPPTA
jgi:hypothetical protein